MNRKRLLFIIGIVILLLLLPLIIMQFSNEVNWSPFDFIIAGGLLLSTGLLIDYAIRKIKKIEYRILVLLAIVAAFLLIWAEFAVGIFGSPLAGS